MLENYLKTSMRNLRREKEITTLNLSGLALGITSSLILFLLVRHMSSYDTYQSKRERIYRVVTESDGNNGKNYTSGVPPVLPEAFRNDFPEAEEVMFTSYQNGGLITLPQPTGEPKRYGEEHGIVFTQSNFFRILDRKILAGNASNGLDEPNQAIISKKLALKYFEREEVIGEVVAFDKKEYRITAVMEDFPANTDFPFDLMLSYITIKKEREENGWHSIWSDEHCYFLLRPDATIAELERRMPEFEKKYLGEDALHESFALQPFTEIHFDDRYGNYNCNTVSRGMLSILTVIAIFLIVTACINFINLSTAEAIKRSKEVGIRKSLCSTRNQLIVQFLGEAGLVTLFAMILAILCTKLGLSFLNPFLDLHLSVNFLSDAGLWIFVIGISLAVAGLSGLYPSLVVSGFNPVTALKNSTGNKNSSGFNLRRTLVVMQFSISQFFIFGTIVLISQMNYYKTKNLGFHKDAIITVPIPESESPLEGEGTSKMRALREEISGTVGVELASLSNTPPSSGSVSGTSFTIEGNEKEFESQIKLIDGNYVDLYGLKLVAGENVQDIDTAQGFLVNEKLATMVGYKNPEEIIGKKMKMWRKTLPVRGVVKDFHTVSLHDYFFL